MKVETVYTEDEWMRHVERHGRKILKKYLVRKIKYFIPVITYITVIYLAIVLGSFIVTKL